MKATLSLVCSLTTFLLLTQASLMAHPGHPHPEWDEVDEFAAENFKTSVVHHVTSPDHLFSILAMLMMIAFPVMLVIMLRKFMGRTSGASLALAKVNSEKQSPSRQG
jgi:hydrogenase/urease accessory protein HupE